MATNAIGGFRAQLRVSSDGLTYTRLGEVQVLTLDDRAAEIAANHHDDIAYENAIQGRSKWRLTGTVNYIYNDAGQAVVRTAKLTQAPLYVKLMPYELVGREKFTGQGIVVQWGISGDDNAVAGSPFEISGSGALVPGTIVAGDLA